MHILTFKTGKSIKCVVIILCKVYCLCAVNDNGCRISNLLTTKKKLTSINFFENQPIVIALFFGSVTALKQLFKVM